MIEAFIFIIIIVLGIKAINYTAPSSPEDYDGFGPF
jgi:hypothetical protein